MKIISLLALIFLIGLVSANGLQVIESSVSLNKTEGIDETFYLQVQNQENFKFFNISLDNNDLVMDKFDLDPGQSKNVSIKVKKDNPFQGTIKLRGEYNVNIGQSNKTEVVHIYYNSLPENCNLNLIKGDKIVWVNHVLDEIKLKNAQTGGVFATVLEGQNYTKTMNYVEEFDYYATRIDLNFFTEGVCNINVMDTQGLVHNSIYDDSFNVNIQVNYNPTTIETRFLLTDFTIEYNQQKSDIFTIENKGNQPARDIHLSGEWFAFTQNDFTLQPGESKNIGYTIDPLIYETSQTNKTHSIDLIIKGNFEQVNKTFNVFIPYAQVSQIIGNTSVDENALQEFVKYLCIQNPNWEACQRSTLIVNGSGQNISVQLTAQTFKDLIERQANTEDRNAVFQKQQNEINLNTTRRLEGIEQKTEESNSLMREAVDSLKTSQSISVFFGIMIAFAFVIGLGGYLILKSGSRSKLKRMLGLHKGETFT